MAEYGSPAKHGSVVANHLERGVGCASNGLSVHLLRSDRSEVYEHTGGRVHMEDGIITNTPAPEVIHGLGRRKPWPSVSDYDGETHQLVHLVEAAWQFQWPGWPWVSKMLNREYGNHRSPRACRAKYERILKTPTTEVSQRAENQDQEYGKE